jgi:hypothetical protein
MVEKMNKEISNIWLIADEVTVKEAALLFVGTDPDSSAGKLCSMADSSTWPQGLSAAIRAIGGGLLNNTIAGKLVPIQIYGANNEVFGAELNSVDADKSLVSVPSFIAWLGSKGIKTGYFFQTLNSDSVGLDKSNPYYSSRLDLLLQAWRHLSANGHGNRTPKQVIMKFMNEHAAQFGLTSDDGTPQVSAIEVGSRWAKPDTDKDGSD